MKPTAHHKLPDSTTAKPPAKPAGVCCPKCGGQRFKVVVTRHRGPATVRWKRCAKCGQTVRTREKLDSAAG